MFAVSCTKIELFRKFFFSGHGSYIDFFQVCILGRQDCTVVIGP